MFFIKSSEFIHLRKCYFRQSFCVIWTLFGRIKSNQIKNIQLQIHLKWFRVENCGPVIIINACVVCACTSFNRQPMNAYFFFFGFFNFFVFSISSFLGHSLLLFYSRISRVLQTCACVCFCLQCETNSFLRDCHLR